MPMKLRGPDEIRRMLETRYTRQRAAWYSGEGDWPLTLPLGAPSEAEAARAFEAVRAWTAAWRAWSGPGEITWTERRWSRLGIQQIPERIHFASAVDATECLGIGPIWIRAMARRDRLLARWPALTPELPRHLPWLLDTPDTEIDRAITLLEWFEINPASGLYPRQLPVPGVDSKWLESGQVRLTALLRALRCQPDDTRDVYDLCGLRRVAPTLRIRLLDPDLRAHFGGLGDLQAPVEQWATAGLPVDRVFIVENIQTGLAFGDLPGAALILGLGYAVDALGQLPWLAKVPVYYWGDLDTHGLAILDRARAHAPHIASLLMDEETLLAHRALWGREAQQSFAVALPRLTPAEQALFIALRENRWGTGVRLEQERIPWDYAWAGISARGCD